LEQDLQDEQDAGKTILSLLTILLPHALLLVLPISEQSERRRSDGGTKRTLTQAVK
jgi:hypothetical protein